MKNDNPLEKEIEKRVCEYARSLKMLCYKFTSPACSHIPDRLFITKAGVVFFIEFKRKGQKPTAAQEVEIAKIRAQGIPCFVVDNVQEGKMVIEEMNKSIDREATLRKALQEVVECCNSTDDYSSSALLGASIALDECKPTMSDPAF